MSERRRNRLALRARAAIAFGLTSLLLAAVLTGGAYILVRRSLLDERESLATRQAYTNARAARTRLQAPDPDVAALLESLQTGASTEALLRVGDRWFSSSVAVDQAVLPRSLVRGVDDGHVGRQLTTVDGVPTVIVGVPIVAVDASYYELSSVADVAGTLDRLAARLLFAGVLAALAGAAVGLTASGRVLRPLRNMAAVARRIVAGDLDSRLDAEGDGDLAPLVESFNEMLDDLRDRITREARFASDVAHEVRGPLHALASAVEVVKRRRAELPDRVVEAVEALDAQVASFNQLVLDLLEISRFDAGAATLELKRVDLRAFVDALLDDRGERVDIVADVDTPPVDVDTRRLHQVVSNLLDNAANYAGGASRIVVSPGADGRVCLVVEDQGPGVPEGEREAIFERFERGSLGQESGAPRGTGLGLALVTEHVRLHGGSVRVEPNEPQGARFVVELPVER